MPRPIRYIALALIALAGCAEDTAFTHAGFSVTWTIETTNGTPLTCEEVGAQEIAFTLTDADSAAHDYRVPCTARLFETEEWDAVVGKGTLRAVLTDADGVEIDAAKSQKVTLVSGKLDNALGEVVFRIPPEIYAEQAPTMEIAYTIKDGNGSYLSCEITGTRYLTFTLRDAAEQSHPLGTIPCETYGTLFAGHVPFLTLGPGFIDIDLRNAEMETIISHSIGRTLREGDIAIGPLNLYAPPVSVGGDVSLLWEWQHNGAPLDATQCTGAGIDTIALRLWHESSQSWWIDPGWMTATCASTPHAMDPAIVPSTDFSGLYIERFLPAGTYALFLGYYANVEVAGGLEAEVLVYSTPLGAPDDPIALPPDDAVDGRVHFVSDLDDIETGGDMTVTLAWEGDDDTFGPCDTVAASGAAFLLESESGVATDIPFTVGALCRDTLRFPGISKAAAPYTLIVTGLLPNSGHVGWYGRCEGLTPSPTVDGESPPPLICAVNRFPEE